MNIQNRHPWIKGSVLARDNFKWVACIVTITALPFIVLTVCTPLGFFVATLFGVLAGFITQSFVTESYGSLLFLSVWVGLPLVLYYIALLAVPFTRPLMVAIITAPFIRLRPCIQQQHF